VISLIIDDVEKRLDIEGK